VLQYLQAPAAPAASGALVSPAFLPRPMTLLSIQPDWSHAGTPFRHSWAGLGNIDQFRWFVRHDTISQLKVARDELGLRHVRAVGMYCDEMRVLAPDPRTWQETQRPVRTNWQVVDACIEALLGIGVKPVFTTSFTPTALASGVRTVFSTRSNVTPPRDLAAWAELVRGSVAHARDQFGADEIATWYFEAWNEPNLEGFWAGSQAQWFALWDATWRAVKSVDARLRIGGPSTARGEWLAAFLDHTARAGTAPDYLISHIYNNDSAHGALSPFAGPQSDRVNHSPHFASGVIRGARAQVRAAGFSGEIHWNEWGRSWFPTDPVRETANEAAFIVKTMIESSQEADYFAYWCLSDIYDQMGYGAEAFFGGYGMMNLQGLRKPSWQAHQLLNRLGDRLLPVQFAGGHPCLGAGATKRGKTHQVLIYDFAAAGTVAEPGTRRAEIRIPAGATQCRATVIDDNHHNIVAQWLAAGARPRLRAGELEALMRNNQLQSRPVSANPAGSVTCEWQGPGCVLLEFEAQTH
jgi:xylan 1,4-beta-xylosidase